MGARARSESTLPGLYDMYISEFNHYSEARRAWNLQGWTSDWWLRSPGGGPDLAAFIFSFGGLVVGGELVLLEFGVRPALWLYL